MPANLHLTLVLPGLLWPHHDTTLPDINLPALNKLRQWGRLRTQTSSREDFYRQHLWQNSWLEQAKNQLRIDEQCHCLIAIPTHQHAGLHQIQCLSGDILALTPVEAENFCQVLNHWFAEEGWELRVCRPDLWIMITPKELKFSSPSLLDLDGYLNGTTKPIGRDAHQILKFQTELQMLLHEHPLNQQRAQQGELPINALWLQTDSIGSADTGLPLYTNCSWALAAQPLPANYETFVTQIHDDTHIILFQNEFLSPCIQNDFSAYELMLRQWEQQWGQPLLSALRSGDVRQLDIVTDGIRGGLLRIHKPRIAPFWRKILPFNGSML